jgi:hypothetical protein
MFRVFVSAGCLLVAAAIGLAPVADAACPYRNCSEAAQDGVCNIPSTSPCYGPWLDRDHDGIGCEC